MRLALLCLLMMLTLQLELGARSNDCCVNCEQMLCHTSGCSSCPMATLPSVPATLRRIVTPAPPSQPSAPEIPVVLREIWLPPAFAPDAVGVPIVSFIS